MRYHSTKKFAKLAALQRDIESDNPLVQQAARKAKSKMNDTWNKRGGRTTKGFYNSKAKSGACIITKG